MKEPIPLPTCPMAETCKGMMQKPLSGFTLLVPGIVFIILGVMVLIQPLLLVWLVAAALIAMGIAMLMLARFMRKIGQRLHPMEH